MLQAKDLCFRYPCGKRQVLNGFTLEVQPYERVGLIAPSGFGKTTLCKILAGYVQPDSGEVLLDGAPVGRHKGYNPVQMVWQHPELAINPRLRLREVLREGDGIEQRVIDALGIEPVWLDRFPAELSGGELQRFCIARALGRRTKYILADEISTMLDLITQAQIWHFLIDETQRRGISLLAVSHDTALLQAVCTRSVRLAGA